MIIRSQHLTLLALTFGWLAVVGCDSDGSAGAASDGKRIAELTPAEFTRVCKAAQDDFSSKDSRARTARRMPRGGVAPRVIFGAAR